MIIQKAVFVGAEDQVFELFVYYSGGDYFGGGAALAGFIFFFTFFGEIEFVEALVDAGFAPFAAGAGVEEVWYDEHFLAVFAREEILEGGGGVRIYDTSLRHYYDIIRLTSPIFLASVSSNENFGRLNVVRAISFCMFKLISSLRISSWFIASSFHLRRERRGGRGGGGGRGGELV